MIKDRQVRILRQALDRGETLAAASRKANMDETSARKYRDSAKMPSQMRTERDWRTREDPFGDILPEILDLLERDSRLKAITLFHELQRRYPGRFPDSQRRTFERRVSLWRATRGPSKAVMFTQEHQPGRLAASDFTNMNSLGVTIGRKRFDHMVFHCVLTYSNWESVTVCFSESFESLSYGLQRAFWQMGGVPDRHRTDSLSAAVNNLSATHELRSRYQELMDHYRLIPHRINVRQAHENGDVESSHGHFKTAVEQALLLRGSTEFPTEADYREFLQKILDQRNVARRDKFAQEQQHLHELPLEKLDHRTVCDGIRVSSSSVIRLKKNTYSVHSRLIGCHVNCVIDMDEIIVRYKGEEVQRMPRLIGSEKCLINYRHVIDSLVRKPGAFENYKYREEMFPVSYFRIAYDRLQKEHSDKIATRKYLQLLLLAARVSQELVCEVLRTKLNDKAPLDVDAIRIAVECRQQPASVTEVTIDAPDLSIYDQLIEHQHEEGTHHDQSSGDQIPAIVDCGSAAPCDGTGPDEHDRVAFKATDQSASRTTTPRVSRPLCEPCSTGDSGILQSYSVSAGAGGTGIGISQAESNQSAHAGFTSSTFEDLGELSMAATSAHCYSADGITAGWIVSGSSREPADFWEPRLRENALSCCVGRTTDPAGAIDSFHNVQFAGAATADCEAGTAIAERDSEADELRRADHRRSGVCPADTRRDGGGLYASGGTLRTRKCPSDQQSPIQQMGPDLQGLNDNRRGHRSTGPSQRDSGTQRPQLPSGKGPQSKAADIRRPINSIKQRTVITPEF